MELFQTWRPNRSLPARIAGRALRVWIGGPIRAGKAEGVLWTVNPPRIDAALQASSVPVHGPRPLQEALTAEPLHRRTAVAVVKLPVFVAGLLALCGAGWVLRKLRPDRPHPAGPGRVRRSAATAAAWGRPWAIWFAGLGALLIAVPHGIGAGDRFLGAETSRGLRGPDDFRGLAVHGRWGSTPWHATPPDETGAASSDRTWKLGDRDRGLELAVNTFRRVGPGGDLIYRRRSLLAYAAPAWLLLPPALANLAGWVRRRRALRARGGGGQSAGPPPD